MKNYDIINNLSLLACIPKEDLYKVADIESYIIGDILSKEFEESGEISCNIGIGNIVIIWDASNVKFRFEPGEELSKSILEGLNKDSELVKKLENSLLNKITQAYKDLI